jgi:hypothetical protein
MGMIVGELDAEVPTVSFEDVESFLSSTKEYHNSSIFSNEENVYFERNKRPYPWDRRVLEYQGKEFYNYLETTPFSKFKNLINQLPIEKQSRVVLLISQSRQNDYDFNFHFDADAGYGFRICQGLSTDKTFLEIGELLPEFYDHGKSLKKIETHMTSGQIYSITPKKSNTVFCLRGDRYPHRVPVNGGEQRFVLIVRGNILSMDDIKYLQRIEEC